MPRFEGPIEPGFDAGVYYLLGTAMGEGQGYRLLHEPGAPASVQYPSLDLEPARAEAVVLNGVPVRFLCAGCFDHPSAATRYAAAVVEAFPERWQPVYSGTGGQLHVYRRADAATHVSGDKPIGSGGGSE
jgi:hypothetical protein